MCVPYIHRYGSSLSKASQFARLHLALFNLSRRRRAPPSRYSRRLHLYPCQWTPFNLNASQPIDDRFGFILRWSCTFGKTEPLPSRVSVWDDLCQTCVLRLTRKFAFRLPLAYYLQIRTSISDPYELTSGTVSRSAIFVMMPSAKMQACSFALHF